MASKMVSLTAEASSTMMRRLGLWNPWKWMADLAGESEGESAWFDVEFGV